MVVSVRINGIDAAKSSVVALTPSVAASALRQMSQVAYDSMQAGAGRHSRRGDLFASVYNRSAGALRREVGHDPQRAPHAIFVVFGTRPHVIKPKEKKALRWASGGKFAFAKTVHHPGYKGDDYMTPAADAAVRQFDAIINQAFKEAS